MKRIGIKDVAEKAGVSVTSVSRVLNKRGYISEDLYDKVYKAMSDLNYQPNMVARSLSKKRTYYIGLIIPDVTHPFFSELTKEIERSFSENGYKVMLCNSVGNSELEKDYLAMLAQNRVDGMVIGSHLLQTKDYTETKLPIVSIDMNLSDTIPNISSNHSQGGLLAAEELIRSGCKNVIQIMGDTNVKTTANERHKIFKEVMEENGVKCTTLYLETEEFSPETYEYVIEKIFSNGFCFDGIFSTDNIAVRILYEAQYRNIPVPSKLKIVGYDGTTINAHTYPYLTTIQQPIKKIADSAVNTLIQLIDSPDETVQNVIHDVKLLKRGTTKTESNKN